MKLTPALLAIVVAFAVSSATLQLASAQRVDASASSSWTIMVYMADDTPIPLPWADNIDAMEAAEQGPGTTILTLVDPQGAGNTRLLKIQHDPATPSTSIISEDLDDSGQVIPVDGEVDMASPDTLVSFVDFATSAFPADRYVLILWGHGDGWHGLCPDVSDILTLPELRIALDAIKMELGRSLDILAIDSCAEATLELMGQIRTTVDYLVASENNIPSQGLPYAELLDALAANTGQSAEEFGARIAHEYVDRAWETSPYSATMGVFNMSRVGNLLANLDELSIQGVKYDDLFHDSLNGAFDSSETYGIDWYMDLGHLLNLIQGSAVPLELRLTAIRTALSYEEAISSFEKYDNPDPYDGIGVANATGAVIYAPSGVFPDTLYDGLVVSSGSWDEFAESSRAPAVQEQNGPGPLLSTTDSDADGLADVATLSWSEPADAYVAWVFRDDFSGLTECGQFESSTSPIVIFGIIGNLVVAASSVVGESAESYMELRVQLSGTVQITVTLSMNGLPVLEGYQIRMISNNMSDLYNGTELGLFHVNVSVPSDAEVGELITFDAIDVETGDTVGSTKLFLPSYQASVEVEIYEAEAERSQYYAMLLLSILPGLLVLAFAGMMYREKKKRKG